MSKGSGSITISATGLESPLTFENGLTRTANTITLGGNLNQETTVEIDGNNLILSTDGDAGSVKIGKLTTNGVVKTSNGDGTLLVADVDLANEVTGVLPIANGGTGTNNSNYTDSEFVIYNSTDDRLESSGFDENSFAQADHSHSLLTPGTGLTGNAYDGSSAETWNIDFDTDGSSNLVARADHSHTITELEASDWQIFYSDGSGAVQELALGSSGQILQSAGNAEPGWVEPATGTVESVGLEMPDIFSSSPTSVESSGTFTVSFNDQSANTVFAGPASGADDVPTFRALVSDDIPDLPATKITSGTFTVSQGGTGTDDLTGMLKGNGTNAFTGITNQEGNVTFWEGNNTIGGENDFQYNSSTNVLTVSSGTINTDGINLTDHFKLTAGAFDEYVLTSDANGVGTWQPAPTANAWLIGGNDLSANGDFGSSSSYSVNIITNNQPRMKIDGETGFISISGSAQVDQNLTVANGDLTISSGSLYAEASSTINNDLYVNNNLILDNELWLMNASGNYTGFKAPSDLSNIIYTLPEADGSNGQYLTTLGGGSLTWTSPQSSTVSLPAASQNQTMYFDGSGWASSTFLTNNNSSVVAINQASPSNTVVLDVGGNARFGTSSSTVTVDIQGDLNVSGHIDPISLTLQPQSNAPAGNTKGQMYYDNTDGLKVNDGSGWSGITSSWTKTNDDIYYNSGNVGIGNDNPSTELDITGSINSSGTITAKSELAISNSSSKTSSFVTSASQSPNDIKYTLPTGYQSNTYTYLENDGSGNLSWTSAPKVQKIVYSSQALINLTTAVTTITINSSYIRISADHNTDNRELRLSDGTTVGQTLLIQSTTRDGNGARILESSGNLRLADGSGSRRNINYSNVLTLIWDGTYWVETSFANHDN